MIKIISIDDHKLFFAGLSAIMEQEDDLLLINGFEQLKDLNSFLEIEKPDMILLDIHLQSKSGIAIAKEIKYQFPEIKIMMLSMDVDHTYFHELTDIGVEAYLSKEIEAHVLINLIRKIQSGERLQFEKNKVTPYTKSEILSDNFNLTEREIEILNFIKKGYTNQQIADALFRSIWTIKTHRKNIKQKLSIKNG